MISEIVEHSSHKNKIDILNFVAHEIELLDRKRDRLNDKKAIENREIKSTIINVLKDAKKPLTISEMLADPQLATYGENKESITSRKLAFVALQLANDKIITRTEFEKKVHYSY